MVRRDNKFKVLEAAREVIQRSGITGLKFDAVADEANMTRAGVLYHFGSRDELVLALHEHLANAFSDRVSAELRVPYEEASQTQKLQAYVRGCAQVTSRAELLFMLDGADNPATASIWRTMNERWAPPASELDGKGSGVIPFLVRLAADGLWMYEAANGEPLSESQRSAAQHGLLRLLE